VLWRYRRRVCKNLKGCSRSALILSAAPPRGEGFGRFVPYQNSFTPELRMNAGRLLKSFRMPSAEATKAPKQIQNQTMGEAQLINIDNTQASYLKINSLL
jgi:hypothetical protein